MPRICLKVLHQELDQLALLRPLCHEQEGQGLRLHGQTR